MNQSTSPGEDPRLQPPPKSSVIRLRGDRDAGTTTWALGILSVLGEEGHVWARDKCLMSIEEDNDFRLMKLDEMRLRLLLRDRVDKDHREDLDQRLNDPLARKLLGMGQWPGVPVIEWTTQTPLLTWEDGEILPLFGEDPYVTSHRLWYDAPEWAYEGDIAHLGESVDEVMVEEAKRLLLDELMGEFPFVGQADRANALAFLLSPFLRLLVNGPTPLFLVDAPRPGTGKSLLVAACAKLVEPDLAPSVLPRAENAVANLILSHLKAGSVIIWLDNVKGKVDSESLAGVLTATNWRGRLLHSNDVPAWPNRATWALTSNDAKLSNELTRRSVLIGLDAGMEHPATRPIKREDPLLSWVDEHRPELVQAALTLGVWWGMQGCPRPTTPKVMGSFESWEATLRGVLDCAGVPGFLGNVEQRNERDVEAPEGRELVDRVLQLLGGTGVERAATSAELLKLDQVGTATQPRLGQRSSKALGMALSAWKDKPLDGLVLRKDPRRSAADGWYVEDVPTQVGSGL